MSDSTNEKGAWNSLEIAKLLVPIIASVILALIGLKISERLDDFKSAVEQQNKKVDSLVKKRIELYDAIGRKLNGMYTYYTYIGRWKQFSPLSTYAVIRRGRVFSSGGQSLDPHGAGIGGQRGRSRGTALSGDGRETRVMT